MSQMANRLVLVGGGGQTRNAYDPRIMINNKKQKSKDTTDKDSFLSDTSQNVKEELIIPPLSLYQIDSLLEIMNAETLKYAKGIQFIIC